jgi:hypothetical protein
MSDAPIIPQDYVAGLTVVDIGDLRVARGLARRPHSACKHLRLVYDQRERRVFCSDCETDVNAFDAFMLVAERAAAHWESLNRRAEQVKEAEQFAVRSRAAKVMDEAWRSRSMFPCCPHCRRGIAPDDVANGVSKIGKKFEMTRRERPAT